MKIENIRGLLGLARRSRRLAVGSRETRAGLRRGEVRLVIMASDGSARDRDRLTNAAEDARVPACVLGTRETLGEAIGRGPVAVCGITDRHMAAGMIDRLDREDDPPTRDQGRNGGQES